MTVKREIITPEEQAIREERAIRIRAIRKEINDTIDLLIGTSAQLEERISNNEISNKIQARMQYRRLREKLEKIAEKSGIEALKMTLIQEGSRLRGYTPKGKAIEWTGNNGLEERSRYCGTLRIDGKTIFTSGTIAKSFEYIINN